MAPAIGQPSVSPEKCNKTKEYYLSNIVGEFGANINNCNFFVLRKYWATLREIEHLSMNGTRHFFIPTEIGNLVNLRYVYISNNRQLKQLPVSMGKLKNLVQLGLVRNNLNSIPEGIFRLEKLTFLAIAFNNIKSLPEKALINSKINTIYISRPQLKLLPKNLCDKLKRTIIIPVSDFQISKAKKEEEKKAHSEYFRSRCEITMNYPI